MMMMMMMMLWLMVCVCVQQSYYYLDLLSVMCVCKDVAIPGNQTYITQILLRDDPVSLSVWSSASLASR